MRATRRICCSWSRWRCVQAARGSSSTTTTWCPSCSCRGFPAAARSLYRLTRCVERLTFAAADAVISTNESYRRVAIERGKMAADRVVVVRSAPDLSRFVRAASRTTACVAANRYLLAYLGVMGPQDGVDYALRALQLLRDELGRDDFHCVFMGAGDAFDEMVALSEQLGLADIVEFPGRVPDEFVQRCLSTADVCLSPDPLNPLNDVSTMNKVVEYMAMGRPIVSFDLVEARVSAGDAAVYVPANDELAFAKAIDDLLRRPRAPSPDGRVGTPQGRTGAVLGGLAPRAGRLLRPDAQRGTTVGYERSRERMKQTQKPGRRRIRVAPGRTVVAHR